MTDLLDTKRICKGIARGTLRHPDPIGSMPTTRDQLLFDIEISVDALTMALTMDEGGRWLLIRAIGNAQASCRPGIKTSRDLMKIKAVGYASAFNAGRFTFVCDARSSKEPAIFKIQYRSNGQRGGRFSDLIASNGRNLQITPSALERLPVPVQPSAQAHGSDLEIDPIAERLLLDLRAQDRERVWGSLFALKAEVKLFEKSPGVETEPWLGITARETKTMRQICPTGSISQHLYFQNGWLMAKLDRFPDRFGAYLVKGTRAEQILSFTIPSGIGPVDVFEGLDIARVQRGTTWMGQHAILRFSRR